MTMSVESLEAKRGWVTFAAVIMFAVGGFRIISGIAYLADSNKVANLSQGIFGDHIFWWGVWDLVIAVAALYAAWSLLNNGTYGRFVAWLWAILVIIESFSYIGFYPGFAIAMIALATLVVYGLTVSSGEADTARM